jgi:signal transduction histidine kinase/ActR/RegA family two-component response regulator
MRLDLSRPHLFSLLRRYGLAVGVAALSVVSRRAIFPLVGADVPFLLLLVPIVIVTWYGGWGPGVLGAALLCTAGIYYFLPPYGTWSFTHDSGIHAVVFGIECAIMTTLTAVARAGHCRTKDTARRMTGIYKISGALGSTRSIDDIAQVILDEAVRVLGVHAVGIYIRSDPSGALRLEGLFGRDLQWAPLSRLAKVREIPFEANAGVALAARSREVLSFENLEQQRKRFPERFDDVHELIPPAVIHAPMIVHDETLGILVMAWAGARRFSEADRQWAQGVAQDCAHALERTRLFEAEHRARVRAEDATRAQESFFSSVSHELRAPLMTIMGWAHTLSNKARRRLDPYERHGLDVIERSAQAQTRLVDDVIEMSRVASQRVRIDVKSAKIALLVRSWLDDAHDAAKASGVELEMGANADAAVAVDIGRLRLAMRKILADALEASPKGGRVCIASEFRGGRVLIRVRHQGNREPADAPHSSSPSGNEGRAAADDKRFGLNLAMANVVVQQHGGTISVDSPGPGGVTTVTLELPALDPMAGLLATSSRSTAEATLPLSGARVLLVDDDSDAREALGELLSADGAEVRVEPSANAGLAALDEFAPTVIISDLFMPENDGYSFIRAVRALPTSAALTPALALTARAGEDDEQAALDAGFQRRMTKPPRPQELTDAIAKLQASRIAA